MRSLELHDFFQHRCDLNLPLHLEEYWQSICPHEPQQLDMVIIATYYYYSIIITITIICLFVENDHTHWVCSFPFNDPEKSLVSNQENHSEAVALS